MKFQSIHLLNVKIYVLHTQPLTSDLNQSYYFKHQESESALIFSSKMQKPLLHSFLHDLLYILLLIF